MRFRFIFACLFFMTFLISKPGHTEADLSGRYNISLDNGEDKIQFIVNLTNFFPSLITDSVVYDVDIFSTLEKQAQIQSQLQKMPDYTSLLKTRKPIVDIEVYLEKESTTFQKSISPAALHEFKTSIADTFKKYDSVEKIKKFIQKSITDTSVGHSQGMLIGLINTLPKERRPQVFKMTTNEQVRTLEKELPLDLSNSSFQASRFGLDNKSSSKRILRNLQLTLAKEKVLSKIIQGLIVTDFNVSDTNKDTLRKIEDMSEAHLDLFKEKEIFSGRLKLLGQLLNLPERWSKKMEPITLERIKHLESNKVIVETQNRSRLLLREVPPILGIFRGFAGNDCATQLSFSYPNSPNEHVFFIVDPTQEGKILGYASGTRVLANGAEVFYLHTINGPKLNTPDTETTIEAIRKHFGNSGIPVLIPTTQDLSRFSNYTPIRTAFQNRIADQTLYPMTYPDEVVRRKLSGFVSSANYDDVKDRAAHSLKPSLEKVTITVRPSSLQIKNEQFNPVKYFQLALKLIDSDRASKDAILEKVLIKLNIPLEQLSTLSKEIQNPKQLSVPIFFATIQRQIEHAIRSPMSETDFESLYPFLTKGYLASPDFKLPEHRQLNKKFIGYAIEGDQETVDFLISKHSDIFIDYPKEFLALANDETEFREAVRILRNLKDHPQLSTLLDTVVEKVEINLFFDLVIKSNLLQESIETHHKWLRTAFLRMLTTNNSSIETDLTNPKNHDQLLSLLLDKNDSFAIDRNRLGLLLEIYIKVFADKNNKEQLTRFFLEAIDKTKEIGLSEEAVLEKIIMPSVGHLKKILNREELKALLNAVLKSSANSSAQIFIPVFNVLSTSLDTEAIKDLIVNVDDKISNETVHSKISLTLIDRLSPKEAREALEKLIYSRNASDTTKMVFLQRLVQLSISGRDKESLRKIYQYAISLNKNIIRINPSWLDSNVFNPVLETLPPLLSHQETKEFWNQVRATEIGETELSTLFIKLKSRFTEVDLQEVKEYFAFRSYSATTFRGTLMVELIEYATQKKDLELLKKIYIFAILQNKIYITWNPSWLEINLTSPALKALGQLVSQQEVRNLWDRVRASTDSTTVLSQTYLELKSKFAERDLLEIQKYMAFSLYGANTFSQGVAVELIEYAIKKKDFELLQEIESRGLEMRKYTLWDKSWLEKHLITPTTIALGKIKQKISTHSKACNNFYSAR